MLDIKDILDCKLKIKTDKNVIEITFNEFLDSLKAKPNQAYVIN